jgi:hypothetical protein
MKVWAKRLLKRRALPQHLSTLRMTTVCRANLNKDQRILTATGFLCATATSVVGISLGVHLVSAPAWISPSLAEISTVGLLLEC